MGFRSGADQVVIQNRCGFEKRVLSKMHELVCPRLRWITGAHNLQFNSSAWPFLHFRLPAFRRWFFLRWCFDGK